MASPTAADERQLRFEDLAAPLAATTFVVVDLETTGGSADRDAITEIGAVKVRGGEVLGEFATLVDPGRPIPPPITRLTGITDAMVRGAPSLGAVIPMFEEFSRGTVLVAHHAPFDVGFLRAAYARLSLPWPGHDVIDTVRLARRVLPRAQAPSVKLSVLARLLGATVRPTHRALDDARATVDVLHALLARLDAQATADLSALKATVRGVDPSIRRLGRQADGLPAAPGVYLFRDETGTVLYVGTSRDLRSRVRSYFSAPSSRRHIDEMLRIATRLDHVVCATDVEARVRELRLIAAQAPRYNRRSRHPDRICWVLPGRGGARPRVTRRQPPIDDAFLGPYTRIAEARLAARALVRITTADPGAEDRLAALCAGRDDAPLRILHARVTTLAERADFAAAAEARDELTAVVAALVRRARLVCFAAIPEIVGVRPDGASGGEIVIARHGRLVAADLARRGTDPLAAVAALRATAESVVAEAGPLPAATAAETALVVSWFEDDAVRLVHASVPWAVPARPGGRWRRFAEQAARARDATASPRR